MRILVIGAGAVGGYFGACLARAGRDVTFLVRGGRAEQLRRDGLRIVSPQGDFTVQPKLANAADLAAGTQPFDLIVLSTKAYQLDGAMNDFAPAVGPSTAILPLLNGMRHLDTLSARFGAGAVLGGSARIVSDIDAEGRIVLGETLHEIIFGEISREDSPRSKAIFETLSGAGFDATHSPDIIAAMWRKWILLASLGTICILGRGTVGAVAQAPGGAAMVEDILREAREIAGANGYGQDSQFVDAQYGRFTDPNSRLTSSMYRDLMKGAPVEADHILGDLIARGEPHGVHPHLLRAAYVQLGVYSASLKR